MENGQWVVYPAPFADVIREITQFYDNPGTGGNDLLTGGPGDDRIWGQLGDDILIGEAGDDELIGGAGSNQISGGDDNDVITGQDAVIQRAYDADGLPRLNIDGSWHRDVMLQRDIMVTGIMDIDSTLDLSGELLAQTLYQADLVMAAGLYHSDGSPVTVNGVWQTRLVLIDLPDIGQHTLDGGSGNDIIFGDLGNDTILGGDDNDTIFGDEAQNVVSFDTDLPHVLNALRVTNTADDQIVIRSGGTVIADPLGLKTAALDIVSPYIFDTPFGAVLPQSIRDISRQENITDLPLADGSLARGFFTFVPAISDHREILPGNDTIEAGAGDDLVFGDKGLVHSELANELQPIVDARTTLWNTLQTVLAADDYLMTDLVGYAGSTDEHDLVVGADSINSGDDNDMVFGDNGVIIQSFVNGLPDIDNRYVDQAMQLQRYLLDMNRLAVDTEAALFQMHYQLVGEQIASAGVENPKKEKIKSSEQVDPDLHDLYLNNDTIDSGAGEDLVVGDDGTLIVTIVGDSPVSGDTGLSFDPAITKDTESALKDQAKAYDKALANHVDDLALKKLTYKSWELDDIAWDYPYDLSIHNNSVDGGLGDDVVFGNTAVIALPVVQTSVQDEKEARQLEKDIDALLKDIGRFVDDQYDMQSGKIQFANHPDSFIDRGGNRTLQTINAANDSLNSAGGNDYLIGDSATLFSTVDAQSLTDPYAVNRTLNFKIASLKEDVSVRQIRKYDKKASTVNIDTIEAMGDVIAYGQWGADTMSFDQGIAQVYGGSGKDTITTSPDATVKSSGGDLPAPAASQAAGGQFLIGADPFRSFLLSLTEAQSQPRTELTFIPSLANRVELNELASAAVSQLADGEVFIDASVPDTATYFQLVDSGQVPDYVEFETTVTIDKPGKGLDGNGYIIFDRQEDGTFKFAGISARKNKLIIGHYDGSEWIIDAYSHQKIKYGQDVALSLLINGTTASLVANTAGAVSFTFDTPITDGSLGIGTDNSSAHYNDITLLSF